MKKVNITIELNDPKDWHELINRLKHALPVMPNGYHSICNKSRIKAEMVENASEEDLFTGLPYTLPRFEVINGIDCIVWRSNKI